MKINRKALCLATVVVLACNEPLPPGAELQYEMDGVVYSTARFGTALQTNIRGGGDGVIRWGENAGTIAGTPVKPSDHFMSDTIAMMNEDQANHAAWLIWWRHRNPVKYFHYNPDSALDGTCTWAPDTYCTKYVISMFPPGRICVESCNVFNGNGCGKPACNCCDEHDQAYKRGGTCSVGKQLADMTLGACVARCTGDTTQGIIFQEAVRLGGVGNFHEERIAQPTGQHLECGCEGWGPSTEVNDRTQCRIARDTPQPPSGCDPDRDGWVSRTECVSECHGRVVNVDGVPMCVDAQQSLHGTSFRIREDNPPPQPSDPPPEVVCAENLECFPGLRECEERCCDGVCERRINCGGASAHKCFR